MIKAGIIGGTSLAAGEIFRLLLNHPDVKTEWIHAPEYTGQSISDIHHGLIGETDLRFTDRLELGQIDLLFMFLGRGEGRKFIERNELPENLRIIDLSGDYRLDNPDNDFVYSLPELNRKELVRGAKRAVVPGALATAVELALLPLAKHLMLNNTIHVSAITGRTGDDSPILSNNNSLPSFTAPLANTQVEEIRQTLRKLQSSFGADIDIVSMHGCHERGMAAIVYFDSPIPAETVISLFNEYYDDHSFTFISSKRPAMEEVVNTNKCILHIDNIGNKLVITSMIDNNIKGCAGQAVHAMNLLFGLHERVGLQLKASVL